MQIVFVCRKNSCRSSIAAAFACVFNRGDLSTISSAGLEASQIHPMTIQAMAEVGIDVGQQPAQELSDFNPEDYDVVAAMCRCGADLPMEWVRREIFQEWDVEDPR
jgi:arsenate reductase (thioredoxin)